MAETKRPRRPQGGSQETRPQWGRFLVIAAICLGLGTVALYGERWYAVWQARSPGVAEPAPTARPMLPPTPTRGPAKPPPTEPPAAPGGPMGSEGMPGEAAGLGADVDTEPTPTMPPAAAPTEPPEATPTPEATATSEPTAAPTEPPEPTAAAEQETEEEAPTGWDAMPTAEPAAAEPETGEAPPKPTATTVPPTPEPTATATAKPTATPVQNRPLPAYRETPSPPYPEDARNEGVEGTVQVAVLVGEDGRVREASIVESSGDKRLDDAAMATVRDRWTFEPAVENGKPVAKRVTVPVEFQITSN